MKINHCKNKQEQKEQRVDDIISELYKLPQNLNVSSDDDSSSNVCHREKKPTSTTWYHMAKINIAYLVVQPYGNKRLLSMHQTNQTQQRIGGGFLVRHVMTLACINTERCLCSSFVASTPFMMCIAYHADVNHRHFNSWHCCLLKAYAKNGKSWTRHALTFLNL